MASVTSLPRPDYSAVIDASHYFPGVAKPWGMASVTPLLRPDYTFFLFDAFAASYQGIGRTVHADGGNSGGDSPRRTY